MHITLETHELGLLDVASLPDGTIIFERDKEGLPIKTYMINADKLDVITDHVENARPWKKGEEEAWLKGKCRAAVMDYFLSREDNGPQREYRSMCNLEYKVLDFIKHAGSYLRINDKPYYLFEVKINRDSKLSKVEKELSWAFKKIADYYSDIDPLEINIFEHTLSQYGIYSMRWDRKDTFEIVKTTYGHSETIHTCSSLRDMIEYVSENLYYERKTEKK